MIEAALLILMTCIICWLVYRAEREARRSSLLDGREMEMVAIMEVLVEEVEGEDG